MSLKAFPEVALAGETLTVRDWLRSLHAEVVRLGNAVASATGELRGSEDISGAVPADSAAATVADLRTDYNGLLAALRAV